MNNHLFLFDWLRSNPNIILELQTDPQGINVSIRFMQGNDNAFGSNLHIKNVELDGMTDSRFVHELEIMMRKAMDAHKKEREKRTQV